MRWWDGAAWTEREREGFFSRRRAEEQRRVQAESSRLVEERQREVEDDRRELLDMIQAITAFPGLTKAESPQIQLQLRKTERAFGVFEGAGLIEPRRARGSYQGGYSGFSFRIAKGIRYNIGGSRGTYMPGEERPTVIDYGCITVTNQRVIFQGPKQSREWAFTKLLGLQHDPQLPWTAIHVSNRQKVSGFLYDDANATEVRFRLALAIAHFNGATAEFEAELRQQLKG